MKLLEPFFPAKVTPPRVTDKITRPRLLDRLQAATSYPLTWIAAPAGSGKTTLVADYLQSRSSVYLWYNCDSGDADPASFFYYLREAARRIVGAQADALPLLHPEFVTDLRTFARRFFESLSQKLLAHSAGAGSAVLVFDNFQDLPLAPAAQAILTGGPEGLSPGVRAILIGSAAAPPVLARLQAAGLMAQLDFEDLRFTPDETRALVGLRQPQPPAQLLQRVDALAQGWVAGIVLILAGPAQAWMAAGAPFTAGFDRRMHDVAEAIFNGLPAAYRPFLLQSALLPTVHPVLANRLVGTGDALEMLGTLCRGHLFVERLESEGSQYQYHPLLREFLLARARLVYSAEQWNAVRRRAACLLEAAHQVEDAAQLYAAADDSQGLARMVRKEAQNLLAQGRRQTLEGWLAAIHGEPARDPWICYWQGLCRFPQDLPRSRGALQKALSGFQALGDRRGVYLAWAGLVDTYSFGMEDWRPLEECIVHFEQLFAEQAEFPDRDTELVVVSRLLAALIAVRMDHPTLIEFWMERMAELLESPAPAAVRYEAVLVTSVYHLWRGAYEKNAVLLEMAQAELHACQVPALTVIRMQMMVAVHRWITAQYDAALRAVEEGLTLAAESGIHVFDSLLWSFKAAAHLVQGELEQGDAAIAQQLATLQGPARTLDLYFYHVNAAWHALLVGNAPLALEHLQSIARRIERIGNLYYAALWHLGMAQTQFLLEQPAVAAEHLAQARALGRRMASSVLEWYALSVEAWMLLQQKRTAAGLQALHRALVIARRHGYIHLELCLPKMMRFLLTHALEAQLEPECVRGMIRAMRLTPPLDDDDRDLALAALTHWPFRVRVATMGHFEIRIQAELLSFHGKERKKPLEMLKILIALGGEDVEEDQLADLLWPEAEGDLAHKSLETTLSRLRKLLGGDSSILYRSRRLTLNPADCWVDCLVLRRMLAQLKTLPPPAMEAVAERALALYQGRFLGNDTTAECFAPYRERLRTQMQELLLCLGHRAELAADWSRAGDYYQRAIVIDPLGEECYLRLMVCQRQLGHHSAAVRTYLRCEQSLRAGLAMEPSPETQALYRQLRHPGAPAAAYKRLSS